MNRRTALVFLVLVFIAFLFWYSSTIQNSFFLIVDFFNEIVEENQFLAMVVFFFIAGGAALISPFTNAPLVPIAVAIWGVIPTTLLLLGGWFFGDILAYMIGKHFGYPAFSYLMEKSKFDKWISTIKNHTTFTTALLLRIALPAELGYVFGIIRYKFSTYLFITFISEAIFSLASTYASNAILSGRAALFFESVGILLIILYVAYEVAQKRNKPEDIH